MSQNYIEIIIIAILDIIAFVITLFIIKKYFEKDKKKSEKASIIEIIVKLFLSLSVSFCTHTISSEVIQVEKGIIHNEYYELTLSYIKDKEYDKAIIAYLKIPENYHNEDEYTNIRDELGKNIVDNCLIEIKENNIDYYSIKQKIEKAIENLDKIGYSLYEKLKVELSKVEELIKKEEEEKKEEKEKVQIENAKNNQVVLVEKMYPEVYSEGTWVMINLYFEPTIKNKSNKDIKDIKLVTLHFDKDGYPDKNPNNEGAVHHLENDIKDVNISRNSSKKITHFYTESLDQDNVLSSVHSNGFLNSELINQYKNECQAIGCVKSVTFYDGTTWENDYYKYWIKKYKDQRLYDE